MAHQNCQLHPSFKTKPVYELHCLNCENLLCVRGMRAILLADKNVELYSTDQPPHSAVQLVGEDFETNNCLCRIKDVACNKCGDVVGYHVTIPCKSCLNSCNNGHFWMYHSHLVEASERLDASGFEILVWARAPLCGEDERLLPDRANVAWIECCR